MTGGCIQCLRYLIFVVNFFFWLLGMVLVAVGVWGLVEQGWVQVREFFDKLGETTLVFIFIFLIVLGLLMAVIGFFGCCGAYQESICLLIAYLVTVALLIAAQVGLGVFIYVRSDLANERFNASLLKVLNETSNEGSAVGMSIIMFQNTVGCCGVNSYWDYKEFTLKYSKSVSPNGYPASCCNATQTQSKDTCTGPNAAPPVPNPNSYANFLLEGCKTKLQKLAKEYLWVFFAVAGVILVLELLAVLFALVLCCSLRREEYELTDSEPIM
jgi:hypothetical protein